MRLIVTSQPIPLTTNIDGVVCVGKTRVTLDTVVVNFLNGATAEEIVQQYPSLQLADTYTVIGYYLQHQTEIDRYIEERQQKASLIRRNNEHCDRPEGIKQRLLSRRSI